MKNIITTVLFTLLSLSIFIQDTKAQSPAHDWIELLLQSIREDLARPTVHARNLHHTSSAMYDAWAIFNGSETYLLGKTVGGYTSQFDGFTPIGDPEEAMLEALDFAAYRLLRWRFANSPGWFLNANRIDNYMTSKGRDIFNFGIDYSTGDAAQLGNYIFRQYQQYGLQDGAREAFNYSNAYYTPVNNPLLPIEYGNPNLDNPNRWQPLTLEVNIDQSGNIIPGDTPPFLSPEWGNVTPFALTDPTTLTQGGNNYQIYIDPGFPMLIDTVAGLGTTDEYEWGFSLVSKWSSHLDPSDGVMWDISPGTSGNIAVEDLPTSFEKYKEFYNLPDGGDPGTGRAVNPKTGQPYAPNPVLRGDYTRVLAEFWADGPDSETPPGHWFTILNEVNNHPELVRKFEGNGPELSELEWDIKSYFTLAGAMHDAAINTWSLKGYYDYIRPVSAIRFLADKGQSSDPSLPNYHVAGIKLEEGFVELIEVGDPLAGTNGEFINDIKLYSWQGPDFITNPGTDVAGVGWIRAGEWWPYQRPTFVTPNFAGYVSGHSTFSRAAAEVLTAFTGDEYFPGGMGVFEIEMNDFLVFEQGPSQSFELQWATYRDASDQTSLSRIWGGIHPPIDDIPGRRMGIQIAAQAMEKAKSLFLIDEDEDGFLSDVDCDDTNPEINPGSPEVCNGLDNDCNGLIDDGLPLNTYYADADLDGFGDFSVTEVTCQSTPPLGFVTNDSDCDDTNADISPGAAELCDEIDNNCDGALNAGLVVFTYFEDSDGDGFGDVAVAVDTCIVIPPPGFVIDATDCDDLNGEVNPMEVEICDAIDNNCDGQINEGLEFFTYYLDFDTDGFGDSETTIDTCITTPPIGFVSNSDDCNDNNATINPNSVDIADNGIDEDCSGFDLYLETKIFANPFSDMLEIRYNTTMTTQIEVFNVRGQVVSRGTMLFDQNFVQLPLSQLIPGIYWVRIIQNDDVLLTEKILKD